MRLVDLTGKKFGRLTVLHRAKNKKEKVAWLCKCSCGNEIEINSESLKRGLTKSCGCLRSELSRDRRKTHGHTLFGEETPEYKSWLSMFSRCRCKKGVTYKNYGARGIKVCIRWNKFENFYKDMGDRPEGTSLDRINNNKGYSPKNCRWATNKEQARNKRNNRKINIKGKIYTLIELAELTGKHRETIRKWLKNGYLDRIEQLVINQ